MAGLDEVLQRVAMDSDFAAWVVEDPKAALAPYDLTTDEIRLLASRLDAERNDVGAGFAGLFETTE
jgi:hypothetical protein